MDFSTPTIVSLAAAVLLELVICILAFQRKLSRVLPFFTPYVVCVLGADSLGALVYYFAGYSSTFSARFYWVAQALLITLRGLVTAGLCWSLLQHVPGVWKMTRSVLLFSAIVLLASAAVAARNSRPLAFAMIAATEKRLEICILALLIIGLAFCKYYGVAVPSYIAWIALGLGFYSAVQVANSSVWSQWLQSYFRWWGLLSTSSFDVATLLWIVGLRHPVPALAQRSSLLDRERYETLVPQMSVRLRNLNARLEGMLR
ncbi:MAG: hypothetical protein ACRD50_14745 [Candidatus Acidiferrales bacterium]